jgi:hypothetical protein
MGLHFFWSSLLLELSQITELRELCPFHSVFLLPLQLFLGQLSEL